MENIFVARNDWLITRAQAYGRHESKNATRVFLVSMSEVVLRKLFGKSEDVTKYVNRRTRQPGNDYRMRTL